jgi:hypothetical protein
MLYGSDTKWCLTEEDGEHYEEEVAHNNIYYIISKKLDPKKFCWAKIAVLVDRFGDKTYWDALDFAHDEVPQNLQIPKFKTVAPTHITINGKHYENINNLPKNLKVAEDLYLQHTKIASLPEGLKVEWDLNIRGTDITSLPEGLEVGRVLELRDTKITSLPEGLKVGRLLDLSGSEITSLPKDLDVGSLYLQGTNITSLPVGLKVRNCIFVDDPAKIKCSDELRRKLR